MKLDEKIKYDSVKDRITQQEFDFVIEFYDPTINKEYSAWLVQQYIKDKDYFKPIPVAQIYGSLSQYDKIKKKKNFPVNKKNIFDFDLREFLFFMKTEAPKILDNVEAEEALSNSTIIFKDDNYIFVHPKTNEASIYFGKNFDDDQPMWCTANPRQRSHYKGYTSDGDLFILRPIDEKGNLKTEGSYQLYIPDYTNKEPDEYPKIEYNDWVNLSQDVDELIQFLEKYNHIKKVQYVIELIEKLYNIKKTNKILYDSINYDARTINIEKMKYALEKGADVNYEYGYALSHASDLGHIEAVKLLIEYGADVKINDNESLLHASSKGRLEIIKMLVEAGANVNEENRNGAILLKAVQNNRIEAVKLLLELGADPNVDDVYALTSAVNSNQPEIVRLLLKYGADVNTDYGHCLVNASRKGYEEIVTILLQYGADVHVRNDLALVFAKEYNHISIVEILKAHMNKE